MTREEKDLLLKDLCGRLPYGVKLFANYVDGGDAKEGKGRLSLIDSDLVIAFIDEIENNNSFTYVALHEVKPYLFPMSSMTGEQFDNLKNYTGLKWSYNTIELVNWEEGYKTLEFWMEEMPSYELIKVFDWLNKNHFDYRDLIEKGLAIDATNKNIY